MEMKTIFKKIIKLPIFLMFFLLFSCVNKNSNSDIELGTYISGNMTYWIKLKEHNKFIFSNTSSSTINGTFEVANNKLILNEDVNNNVFTFNIEGNKVIFESGEVNNNYINLNPEFLLRNRKLFYNLKEAHELNFLSLDDLKQIEKINNGNTKEPEIEEDILNFIKSERIKELKLRYNHFSTSDNIEIVKYYGLFNNCHVVYLKDDFFKKSKTIKIKDYNFPEFGSNILVFNEKDKSNCQEPTLDDDFDGKTIEIVLRKGYGGVNKPINIKSFETKKLRYSKNIKFYEHISNDVIIFDLIEDITIVDDPSKLENPEMFMQIIVITLKDANKINALRAIDELMSKDFVFSVELDYDFIPVYD